MGLFKSKKEKHALVLMPTAKGAHILVCKKGQSIDDSILYHKSVSSEAMQSTLKSFFKLNISMYLLLDYAEYQLCILEDKGTVEPELSKTIPWECSEFLPYLPEEGEYFYFKSKREKLLYVFAFHTEKLMGQLQLFNLGLSQFDSVVTLDCAWANYLVSQENREQVLFIDVTSSFTRIIYIESASIESIHKFDVLKNELDVMKLSEYCRENFMEAIDAKVPIVLNNMNKSFLSLFKKNMNQTCLEFTVPKFSSQDLACLGVGVAYA